MGNRLRVVTPLPDRQIIDSLLYLLAKAEAGDLTGFAYVALYKQDKYSADLVGTVASHPLLSRGVCRALEDAIALKSG